MKVLIDLIEDIQTALSDQHHDFSLFAMALQEDETANHTPTWQAGISHYSIDESQQKIYFFLGKESHYSLHTLFEEINKLSQEAMMYEVLVTYSKEEQRVDQPLIGFGEAVADKKYLLFIAD